MSVVGRRETALRVVMRFLDAECFAGDRIGGLKFGQVIDEVWVLNQTGLGNLGRCCKGVGSPEAYRLLRARLRVTYRQAANICNVPWVDQPNMRQARFLWVGRVEARGADGTTALMRAARAGSAADVAARLSLGSEVNAANRAGTTALGICLASRGSGMMEIAKLLLASGADGGEALQRAVGRCDIVGVKWLLAVGVDIDARDEEGNTALIWATRRKDQIMVRHLLDARANAAIRNQWGSMALSFARGVDVQLAAMLTEALALRNGTVLGRL